MVQLQAAARDLSYLQRDSTGPWSHPTSSLMGCYPWGNEDGVCSCHSPVFSIQGESGAFPPTSISFYLNILPYRSVYVPLYMHYWYMAPFLNSGQFCTICVYLVNEQATYGFLMSCNSSQPPSHLVSHDIMTLATVAFLSPQSRWTNVKQWSSLSDL